MTKSIVALILLAGSLAQACPNLSGTYVCEGGEMVVSQAEVDGVTTYTLTDSEGVQSIVADGKPYSQTESDQGITYTMTTVASCAADTLNLDMNMALSDDKGTKLLEVNAKAVVSLDASGNLVTQMSADDGSSETAVCTRK